LKYEDVVATSAVPFPTEKGHCSGWSSRRIHKVSPVFSPPGNWDDFHVPQWPVGSQQEIRWKVDEEAFYTFIIYLHRIANDVEPNVHDEINEGPIYGKPLLHRPLARTALTLEQPGN
jgi:hypothetical protein